MSPAAKFWTAYAAALVAVAALVWPSPSPAAEAPAPIYETGMRCTLTLPGRLSGKALPVELQHFQWLAGGPGEAAWLAGWWIKGDAPELLNVWLVPATWLTGCTK